MAQWVRVLTVHTWRSAFRSQDPCKELGVVTCTCNPGAQQGQGAGRDSVRLTGQPVQLNGHFQVQREMSLK